jgi:hypothetical protein
MGAPETDAALEDRLATPSAADIACLRALSGDIIILGVSGKMGPSLARLVRRAADQAGTARRVIGVARFSDPAARRALDTDGVETIAADLLDARSVAKLPVAPHVLFLVGRKFGTGAEAYLTWATNTVAPAHAFDRYRKSRIVVLSTGNVYPFVTRATGGARETTQTRPIGEYAQSCLGRERIAEHFSRLNQTPMLLVRLNYASDLRYGVLVDIARKVRAGELVDLGIGYVNTIWQGDANSYVLRGLEHCASPPAVLNVTGPETLRVRDIAHSFGRAFGCEPRFTGAEGTTALLSDARDCFTAMGPPAVTAEALMAWTAEWVARGGAALAKPTAYEVTTGQF